MLSSTAVLASSTLILFWMIDIHGYDVITPSVNNSLREPISYKSVVPTETNQLKQTWYKNNGLSWRDAHLATFFYLKNLSSFYPPHTGISILVNASSQTEGTILTPTVLFDVSTLPSNEENKVQTTIDESLQIFSLNKNDVITTPNPFQIRENDELNLEIPNYIIQTQHKNASTSTPSVQVQDETSIQNPIATPNNDPLLAMLSGKSFDRHFYWNVHEIMKDSKRISGADSEISNSGKSGDNQTTDYDVLEYITEPILTTNLQRRPNDYQFIVSIWLRYEIPEYHAVGALITLRHVLTAAHSISWKAEGSNTPVPFDTHMIGVRVREGNENISSVEYDVVDTYIHYKWWKSKGKIRPYDTAILKLKDEVKLDLWSSLAEVVSTKDVKLMMTMYNYTNCVSVHWAREQLQDLALMETQVRLIPSRECNRRLKKDKSGNLNQSLELCVIAKGTRDLCPMDRERVLLCEGKLIGVLISDGACTDEEQPQVYIRLDVLTNWIYPHLQSLNKTLLRKVDELDRNKSGVHFISYLLWIMTIMPFTIK